MRIILIGPPGSGKGTQAKELADKYKIPHISMGEILRDMGTKTALGKKLKPLVNSGQMVPEKYVIEIIAERIEEADCKKGFILDGFPRGIKSAKALDKMLGEKNINIDAVVEINVEDEYITERLCGRFNCSACGEGYHDKFKKPKLKDTCDICGIFNKFARRSDDNEKTAIERLKLYYSQTKPVVSFYKTKGLLKTVNGMQKKEAVNKEIVNLIKK